MSEHDLDQVLEAGTILVIETGEYSDYRSEAPVRVLKSATKRELAAAFRAAHPGKEDLDAIHFLPWLTKAGYVEAVDGVNCWHVGSYGFDPMGR